MQINEKKDRKKSFLKIMIVPEYLMIRRKEACDHVSISTPLPLPNPPNSILK